MYDINEMPKPLPLIETRTPNRPKGEFDEKFAKQNNRCSTETALELRANYCGNVTLIDRMIGEIIELIRKRGEWDNTVVLFTSDHGELNGDHGIVKKRNFFRPTINVPLIIRTPDTCKSITNHFSDALVNLIDIGPTLADFAGGKIEYTQFGRSLRPILEGTANEHREYILSEYAGEIMYMDREWKLVLNRDGLPYMLFNIADDPDELDNLAASPEYKDIETELQLKLLRALAENRCIKPSLIQMPVPSPGGNFRRYVKAE